jgi:murein tripeptide amidase MpaA
MFSRLLTRKDSGKDNLAALLHSDIEKLLKSIHNDFPGMVKLKTIGESYQKRPISMAVLDARDHIVKENYQKLAKKELHHFHTKPAILITGQHHSREVITSSMVLFSMLKMLHGAVHNNTRDLHLLMQNKYYIIPTVNVDGLAFIEDNYVKNGVLLAKRTNMHIGSDKCE